MRNNQPINDQETEVPQGQMLVSRTAPDSTIVFANEAFVQVSGFAEADLVGQPHNIVRHPHMPPQAFANLWATLKSGQPWEGFVKNRSKDGGFYWVRANVTPVIEDGRTTGYISVRQRPSRAEVAQAEQAYAALRSGARGVALEQGEIRRTGLRARLGAVAASITGRLAFAFTALIALLIIVASVALGGMRDSNAALATVYADRIVPLGQLSTIAELAHTNTEALTELAEDLRTDPKTPVERRVRDIRENLSRIEKV